MLNLLVMAAQNVEIAQGCAPKCLGACDKKAHLPCQDCAALGCLSCRTQTGMKRHQGMMQPRHEAVQRMGRANRQFWRRSRAREAAQRTGRITEAGPASQQAARCSH